MTLIIVWPSVLLGQASFDPSMISAQAAGCNFTSGNDFRGPFLLQLLPAAVLLPALTAPINMGEELGWRGFLLPRLMKTTSSQHPHATLTVIPLHILLTNISALLH
jgi:membrane protease YdiL (CAAX protease family)